MLLSGDKRAFKDEEVKYRLYDSCQAYVDESLYILVSGRTTYCVGHFEELLLNAWFCKYRRLLKQMI